MRICPASALGVPATRLPPPRCAARWFGPDAQRPRPHRVDLQRRPRRLARPTGPRRPSEATEAPDPFFRFRAPELFEVFTQLQRRVGTREQVKVCTSQRFLLARQRRCAFHTSFQPLSRALPGSLHAALSHTHPPAASPMPCGPRSTGPRPTDRDSLAESPSAAVTNLDPSCLPRTPTRFDTRPACCGKKGRRAVKMRNLLPAPLPSLLHRRIAPKSFETTYRLVARRARPHVWIHPPCRART